MATESDVHAVSTNGHGMPVDWQGVPDDVIHRMELAYFDCLYGLTVSLRITHPKQ